MKCGDPKESDEDEWTDSPITGTMHPRRGLEIASYWRREIVNQNTRFKVPL